jgi:transcriptional regulator with XRE-family HTH domain
MASAGKPKRDIGPRVTAALIPRYFKDLTAIQNATGIAYSTINDWHNGKADPTPNSLQKIASAIEKNTKQSVDFSEWLRPPIGAEITREYLRRYHNLVMAEELARRGGLADDEAIEDVKRGANRFGSDPPVDHWLSEFKLAMARRKFMAANPALAEASAAAERDEGRRKADEAAAEQTTKMNEARLPKREKTTR